MAGQDEFKFPFETVAEHDVRSLRQNAEDSVPEVVGYVDNNDRPSPFLGDDLAPYVHAIGRASSDGQTGSVQVADGDPQRVLTDQFGALWVRTSVGGVITVQHTTVAAAQAAPVVTARRVFEAEAVLVAAIVTDRFLQIHDSAVAVANGAAPLWETLIPGSLTLPTTFAQGGVSFGAIGGLVLVNGLVLAISTTAGTLTLGGADVLPFQATTGAS